MSIPSCMCGVSLSPNGMCFHCDGACIYKGDTSKCIRCETADQVFKQRKMVWDTEQ